MGLYVKKLREDAKLPERATDGSAGYDFFAAEDVVIQPGETAIIPTGIAMSFNPGFVLVLKEKSGIAVKTTLHLKAGVIDADYRGEVGVVYANLGKEPVSFDRHQKVVQGIFLGYASFPGGVQEVEKLDPTSRGVGGYGSTGDY